MPFNVQFRKFLDCYNESKTYIEEGLRNNDIFIKVDDSDADIESSGPLTIRLLKERPVYFSIKYTEHQWVASF